MVLLTRSLCRLASQSRPAVRSRSLFTASPAARTRPSILSTSTAALRYHNLGSIRTLTAQREKVKVLLVLYDGGKHAEEVGFLIN